MPDPADTAASPPSQQVAAGRSVAPELLGYGIGNEAGQSAAGRTRTFKMGENDVVDALHIDPAMIPQGQSWEWKRVTTLGKLDTGYNARMYQQGWRPVESREYPQLVEPGHAGPIIRDGLMLCERPVELTREAQSEDKYKADQVMRDKEAQLGFAPPGTLPRNRANGSAEFNQIAREVLPGTASPSMQPRLPVE